MTPRPFEVGDRVIVKQNAYHGWGAGKTGTIIQIAPDNDTLSNRIYIDFDNGAGEESLGVHLLKDLQFYPNELDFDPFIQCCYDALQEDTI